MEAADRRFFGFILAVVIGCFVLLMLIPPSSREPGHYIYPTTRPPNTTIGVQK